VAASNDNRFTQHIFDNEDFVAVLRTAAVEFMKSTPLYIPEERQGQAMHRVVTAMKSAALRKPEIASATPESIGRSMALSALTGLLPGGPLPEVDLIPRRRKIKPTDPNHRGQWPEVTEVDWQIGWRGYLKLAERAGADVQTPVCVFEGEKFVWKEGLNRVLDHEPGRIRNNFAKLTHCYIVVTKPGGKVTFLVVTREEIEERRAKSEAWRNLQAYLEAEKKGEVPRWPAKQGQAVGDPKARPDSPWADWPIPMAMKTTVRYAASRELFPMDDVGKVAFDHDARKDVIDSLDIGAVVAPTTGIRRTPAALPEHMPDPDEVDPVYGEPDRVRVDPGVRDVVGGGAAAGQAAPAPTEKPPSYTPQGDAEALRNGVLAKYKPWMVPLSRESAIDCLRTALDVRALRPAERYDAAVNHGVQAGWWSWVANGGIKPVAEVSGE
jgi:recombinational DNA repair protein RecT